MAAQNGCSLAAESAHSQRLGLNAPPDSWHPPFFVCRWAEMNPNYVEKLVLLRPTFDIKAHLRRLIGDEGLKQCGSNQIFSSS